MSVPVWDKPPLPIVMVKINGQFDKPLRMFVKDYIG